MDYKEKYEMALEGIQEILSSGEDSIKMSRLQLRLQGIFPELRESEGERIRKELISLFQDGIDGVNHRYNGSDCRRWIAWLEESSKQTIEDIARKVTSDKEHAISFLKSTGIMNEDGQLAEEYRTIEAETDNIEQKPVKWGEEDEWERKRIIGLLEGWLSTFKETCYAEDCKCGIVWLKSLKERVQLQPQQEWSDEDKMQLDAAIHLVRSTGHIGTTNWLISLKERYTWKPSDTQMKRLKEACDEHYEIDGLDPLYTLYEDLKKLKA